MASLFKYCFKSNTLLPRIVQKSQFFAPSFVFRTLASSSSQISPGTGNAKKPLSILFEEAVGLTPRPEELEIEIESESNTLKKKLLELEREIIELKKSEYVRGNAPAKTVKSEKEDHTEAKKSLYSLYTGDDREDREESESVKRKATARTVQSEKASRIETLKSKKDDGSDEKEEIRVFKELSTEMMTFVRFLHREGYFSKANFLHRNKIDLECIASNYSRDFLKFAAVTFGKDHQEIAKWLSGSDLKKIALFGCPTLDRRAVFSAKRLRRFFEIQEDTVCHKCVLKEKCKFPNQSVWKSGDKNNLDLAAVMKVIPLYGLHLVHPNLQVTDEIYASVNKLLEEVINLSQTVPSSGLN